MDFLMGVLFMVFCLPAIFGFALGFMAGSRHGRNKIAEAFAAIDAAKVELEQYRQAFHEETLHDLLTESPGRDVHLKGN